MIEVYRWVIRPKEEKYFLVKDEFDKYQGWHETDEHHECETEAEAKQLKDILETFETQ